MYGKQATINLIKSLIGIYNSNKQWDNALQCAIEEIEKAIDDEHIIDNIKDVIYNDNLTKPLSMIEINRAIRKYIK